MPQEEISHQQQNLCSINETYRRQDNIYQKYVTITKFTKRNNDPEIEKQLVLGKNNLLQTTAQQQLEYIDNDSDVSFQERLEFYQDKNMSQSLNNYLMLSQKLEITYIEEEDLNPHHLELIKQVQDILICQIEGKYGQNQAQKIKFLRKYVKRNDNTAKIYFEVLKNLTSDLHTCAYFLFVETVKFYISGAKQLKLDKSVISESQIHQYVKKNYIKTCQEVQKSEKFQALHYNSKNLKAKQIFQKMIATWLQGFFLCKEGYPQKLLKKPQKDKNSFSRLVQKFAGKQGRKKIKKW